MVVKRILTKKVLVSGATGFTITLALGLIQRSDSYFPGANPQNVIENGLPFVFVQVPTAHHIYGDTYFTPNVKTTE